MSPVLILAVVAIVAVVVLVSIAVRRRRVPDTVTSFQRQIDALSPEARRGVVDQVHRIERRDEPSAPRPASGDRTDAPRPVDTPDDEETERGT